MLLPNDFFDQNALFKRVNELTPDLKTCLDKIFVDEPLPVFEHSAYHISSYFLHGRQLYFTNTNDWQGVVGVDDQTIIIFSPIIISSDIFLIFLKELVLKFPSYSIRVNNVSDYWIKKNSEWVNADEYKVVERSKEEVIYNLPPLVELSEDYLSDLGRLKRKLLDSSVLTFCSLTSHTLPDACRVARKWQETQGTKYAKNKLEKELFVLEQFVIFANKFPTEVFSSVGYINDEPVSYQLAFIHTNFTNYAISYSLKGLNREGEGGRAGVSDATYYQVFGEAFKRGAVFLNDGELGVEPGTRRHKLKFRPSQFIKSYDILIKS